MFINSKTYIYSIIFYNATNIKPNNIIFYYKKEIKIAQITYQPEKRLKS